MESDKTIEENNLNTEVNQEALQEATQDDNGFDVHSQIRDHFSPPSDNSSNPSDNIEGDYDFGSAGSRRESDGESWETVSEELREEAAALEQERLAEDLLLKSVSYSQRLMVRNANECEPLPENVTQIVTNDGAYIYIIGTAHFSKASQEDVEKTIRILQPDMVMVELCASRVGVLKYDEESLMKAAKEINLEKLRYSIKETGSVVSGVMQMLLLSMSAHITKELGMAPGGEFRVACQEARQIVGCKLVLGDRPIQSTIGRAMSSLSVYQKLQLAWHLIFSKESITKEDVERYKQKDMIAEMMAEMTGDFPELSRVFVDERDQYMAEMLSRYVISVRNDLPEFIPIRRSDSMMQSFNDMNDLENNENTVVEQINRMDYKPVIVAVVGIGHMNGIANSIGKQFDLQRLLEVPPPTLASRTFTFTLKASLVAVLSWGVYSIVRWARYQRV
ncbi:traB domain-containing protein-like [Clytia hemisphaerica]|uniref:TraB domain containing protein n=1 Tax=Clytia hemisphaerica TaxID=252671 RepID=A0A7M5XAF1_9CNID